MFKKTHLRHNIISFISNSRFDWILLLLAVALVSIGVIELSSIAAGDTEKWFATAGRQIIFLGLSLLVIAGLFFFDLNYIKHATWLIMLFYIAGIGLLVGLFIFSASVRGVKSWYQIGGLNFEPVEIVKLLLVLVLAKYFSLRHIEMYRVRHVITSFIYTLIPVGLVLAQPDFGSAVLLLIVWFGMVVLSGIKMKHFLMLVGLALIAVYMAWSFLLVPYQQERIISFLNPEYDPQGAGYNSIQAKIAIGDGGLFGTGIGQGTQVQLGYLPEATTDFIFASIVEEWGFVGATVVFALFGLFFYRLIHHAFRPYVDNFTRLLVLGVGLIFLSGFFLNIGMNLNLLPVTGTPLPFLSYGGSHLVSSFLALGLVLRLAAGRG